MITMMERLGVNVVSVIIGAMFFLIAIAWVEALRNVVEYVFFHTEGIKDYHILQKKLLAAVFVTALSGILIVIIYSIYKSTPASHKVDSGGSKPGEAFKEGANDSAIGDFPGTVVTGIEPIDAEALSPSVDISGDLDDVVGDHS